MSTKTFKVSNGLSFNDGSTQTSAATPISNTTVATVDSITSNTISINNYVDNTPGFIWGNTSIDINHINGYGYKGNTKIGLCVEYNNVSPFGGSPNRAYIDLGYKQYNEGYLDTSVSMGVTNVASILFTPQNTGGGLLQQYWNNAGILVGSANVTGILIAGGTANVTYTGSAPNFASPGRIFANTLGLYFSTTNRYDPVALSSSSSTITANTITANTVSDSIGNVRDIPQNAQTSAYVLVATDAGKHISITTGGVTVPSSVFSAGKAVTIYNNSGSNQTITQGSGVTMHLAGTATTGDRTIAQYGVATVLCVAANTFVISGAGVT